MVVEPVFRGGEIGAQPLLNAWSWCSVGQTRSSKSCACFLFRKKPPQTSVWVVLCLDFRKRLRHMNDNKKLTVTSCGYLSGMGYAVSCVLLLRLLPSVVLSAHTLSVRLRFELPTFALRRHSLFLCRVCMRKSHVCSFCLICLSPFISLPLSLLVMLKIDDLFLSPRQRLDFTSTLSQAIDHSQAFQKGPHEMYVLEVYWTVVSLCGKEIATRNHLSLTTCVDEIKLEDDNAKAAALAGSKSNETESFKGSSTTHAESFSSFEGRLSNCVIHCGRAGKAPYPSHSAASVSLCVVCVPASVYVCVPVCFFFLFAFFPLLVSTNAAQNCVRLLAQFQQARSTIWWQHFIVTAN